MTPFLIVGSILGAWSVLLVVSGERMRRVRQIQMSMAAEDAERKARKIESEKPIVVG